MSSLICIEVSMIHVLMKKYTKGLGVIVFKFKLFECNHVRGTALPKFTSEKKKNCTPIIVLNHK